MTPRRRQDRIPASLSLGLTEFWSQESEDRSQNELSGDYEIGS
jgi:hypothetical protein